MITAAHVQHVFASRHLALRRFAQSPELCDRRLCSAMDIVGGTFVYLATAPRTDFQVIVFSTPREAIQAARIRSGALAERRQNVLLLYLRSATRRMAIVRRIVSGL